MSVAPNVKPFIAATIDRFDGTATIAVCLWWLDGNIWKHKCLEEWETASRGAKRKADKAVEKHRALALKAFQKKYPTAAECPDCGEHQCETNH